MTNQSVATYRKRPIEVEAVQVTEHNWNHVLAWVNTSPIEFHSREYRQGNKDQTVLGIDLWTSQGRLLVPFNHWVIKEPITENIENYFYPCDPKSFDLVYELLQHPFE